MTRTLRFVLGDQLDRGISSLAGLDPEHDVVLIAEVMAEATYVRHHKKKIAFLFSAMRHFAESLREEGIRVDYVRLDDRDNAGSFRAELVKAVARRRPDQVVVTEPGEWRVLEDMRGWAEAAGVPVHVREDDRFFCSRAEFARWASGRRGLRMEFFYREMRRKTGLMMDGAEPAGGRWNFDAENRRAYDGRARIPERPRFAPDAITREVLDLVAARFSDHFGDLEPFDMAVTRGEALQALDAFVRHALPRFGDYQDAMLRGEPFLFHAVLSPALNAGLLNPREICTAAVEAWRAGRVPINAAEGFLRQILGWREYVRGVYWTEMPAYAETNALGATRPLPWFYWSGETELACLAEAIGDTKRHAYAHHIQRLMVTGNFALLAGLDPRAVEEWYLVVYADAYEWVELPNTHGMALFADGGLMASKPYAASGAYIDRMSDYCLGCRYSPKLKAGPDACPFNYLYWDFIARNRPKLGGNPRLGPVYRTLDKMTEARRREISADADRFLASLSPDRP